MSVVENTRKTLDQQFGWKEYYLRTLYHQSSLSDIHILLSLMGFTPHPIAACNAKLVKTQDDKYYIELTIRQLIDNQSNFERIKNDLEHINSHVEPIIGLLVIGTPTPPEKIDLTQKVKE